MTFYSLPPVDTRRRLSRRLDVTRDLPADLVEQLWHDDADRVLRQCQILQTKPLCTVGRLQRGADAYTLKRHTWGRLARTARMLYRESVASKCWRVGRRLTAEGVATPLPRARLEYGCGPLTHRSFLLTDYVPGTNLYRVLRRRSLCRGALTVVAEQIVRLWQKLVRLRCTHNDLKPENFIIDDQLQVWLIDLEKVRFHAPTQHLGRRQLADLQRLFHPRVWYNCPELADTFLDLFSAAGWDSLLDGLPARKELAAAGRLTVYVRGANGSQVTDASVEDIADEVVEVDRMFAPGQTLTPPPPGVLRLATQAAYPNNLRVLGDDQASTPPDSPSIEPSVDNQWVLVVEAGDRVTPDLAWEIQQRIAEPNAPDAYRIPREALLGSDPLSPDRGDCDCDVRLFRRRSSLNATVEEVADPEAIGRLENRIEYVRFANLTAMIRHLDQCASWSADGRYRRGQQAHLLRTLLRLPVEFMRRYVAGRYYDLGYNGLQLSVVETAFLWIEEAKLWRQSRQINQGHVFSVQPEPDVSHGKTDHPDEQQPFESLRRRGSSDVRRAA